MERKEAAARIRINKLLESAGWRFVDDEDGRANIDLAEVGVPFMYETPENDQEFRQGRLSGSSVTSY